MGSSSSNRVFRVHDNPLGSRRLVLTFLRSLGRLGVFGFVFFLFATATAGGFSLVSEALLRPYLATNSPSLHDNLSSNIGFIAVTIITIFGFYAGYLVFSVGVVRARVLPKWTFWIMILQVLSLGSILGLTITYAAALAFEGLLGLSIAGWGYAILSTRSRAGSSERAQGGVNKLS